MLKHRKLLLFFSLLLTISVISLFKALGIGLVISMIVGAFPAIAYSIITGAQDYQDYRAFFLEKQPLKQTKIDSVVDTNQTELSEKDTTLEGMGFELVEIISESNFPVLAGKDFIFRIEDSLFDLEDLPVEMDRVYEAIRETIHGSLLVEIDLSKESPISSFTRIEGFRFDKPSYALAPA